MPTKPVLTITEWASDATWTIGPKVTNATKADYSGIAPQGHIPGIDNPSTANEQNDFQNKGSLVDIWVMAGSALKILEAHIVEADASGCAGIACIDVGGTASGQAPAVFGENTGTTAATILASSGANDGIRSEATSLFAMRALSRGQIGSSSFYTAEVDGTWDDTINPAGRAGGLRILADNDELIAPAPPAQHPLNSRALFVRNASGVAVEVVANSSPGVHSDDVAMNVRNFGLKGDGIRVNTQAGPEPLGGHGVISFGGQAVYDPVAPHTANANPGGTGLIGRGGAPDPLTLPGPDGSVFAESGDGVLGFAGAPNGVFGGGPGQGDGGAGIHGISDNPKGSAYAGWFENLDGVEALPPRTNSVVQISRRADSNLSTGLTVDVGNSNAIVATSRGDNCVVLDQQTHYLGVNRGAHLSFRGDYNDPDSPGPGDLWMRRATHASGSSTYLKYDTLLHGTRYVPHFRQPPIRQQVVDGTQQTSLDNTDETTLLTFSLDSRSLPENSIKTAFRLNFRFRITTSTPSPIEPFADLCNIRLYDITAGGGHVANRFITYSPHTIPDASAGPWDDKSIVLIYTIPTGGARDFEIRFLNQASPGPSTETNQIQDAQLELFTWDP